MAASSTRRDPRTASGPCDACVALRRGRRPPGSRTTCTRPWPAWPRARRSRSRDRRLSSTSRPRFGASPIKRNFVRLESAGRGAEEQPARVDGLVGKERLQRQAVDHRLQDAAAIDDRLPGPGAVLPGLVIGDAQEAGLAMALDHVDRAAQPESAVDQRRLGRAVRIAAFHVGQAEREFESLRRPVRAFVRQLFEPDAKVLRHHRDLVAARRDRSPDSGGRTRDRALRGSPRVRRCCAAGRFSAESGNSPSACSARNAARLHLVEQVAARQRIHLLQRRRQFERRQAIDRRHQELVRTRRVALQRGQRVRPRAKSLRRERRLRRFGRSHDAVGRIPLLAVPAQPSRRQRSLQLGAQLIQIARAALRRCPTSSPAAPPSSTGRARSRRSPSRDRAAPATPASRRRP